MLIAMNLSQILVSYRNILLKPKPRELSLVLLLPLELWLPLEIWLPLELSCLWSLVTIETFVAIGS